MNQKHNLSNVNNSTANQLTRRFNDSNVRRAAENQKNNQKISNQGKIKNKLLNRLPDKSLINLLSTTELVYLKGNQNISLPGEKSKYFYFPETAAISEFQILEDGKIVEVAMTGCESGVGFASLFESSFSPNWAQVLIAGRARRMEAKFFRSEISSGETFQRILFDHLCLLITQISRRVACNSHHSIEKRLCCWLMMLDNRCLDNEDGGLALTHEQIARSLGVHRPNVTLITQSLRDKKIIDYWREKIIICDRQKLEQRSCSCHLPSEPRFF